jgi:hypothetical protein
VGPCARAVIGKKLRTNQTRFFLSEDDVFMKPFRLELYVLPGPLGSKACPLFTQTTLLY